MPNTQDPTIDQKVEELYYKLMVIQHEFEKKSIDGKIRYFNFKDILNEAILFGQAHMKQKIADLIESKKVKKYTVESPTYRKNQILNDLLSALNEI